nr:unnamed protein product [Callosobruchus analis]
MATTTSFKSMGELFDENSSDEVLGRLKKTAVSLLPEGWREWRVRVGFDSMIDPTILNKLRFCLPAIDIARAFDPEASCLKERPYRDTKYKTLTWPFCRGLVLSPPSLTLQIRGSALQCELVAQSVKCMQDIYMTRKEASVLLGHAEAESETGSSGMEQSGQGLKKTTKASRISALEQESKATRALLQQILERLDAARLASQTEEEDHGFPDEEEDEEFEAEERTDVESFSWEAPTVSCQPSNSVMVDFAPQTKEQEPTIPQPLSEIKRQGITCQRLGENSWNKIRYADVQRKLQAAPVFSSLTMNAQLKHLSPSNSYGDYLEKTEGSYGTICHGLLLQRTAFQEGLQNMIKACPSAAEVISKELLGEDCAFRHHSDNVLQFVCGKRSEAIELRRKHISFPNHANLLPLNKIPPSESHLFDEAKLEEALRTQNISLRPSFKRKYPYSRQEQRPQKITRKPEKRYVRPPWNKEKRPPSRYSSSIQGPSKQDKSSKNRSSTLRRF